MKKIYLSITLLYAIAHSMTLDAQQYNLTSQGRSINAPIINSIDGKFPIEILFRLRDRIGRLITYNHSPNAATVITLHDLALHEHTFEPAKAQAYLKKCIASVSEVAQTEPCFNLFHKMYPMLDQLVQDWADQFHMRNGKFYAFIKSWQTLGKEHELLTNQIHSLQELEQYLCELHQFLSDLAISCPKAYASYQSRN